MQSTCQNKSMFLQFGFLGHVLTLELSLTQDDDDEGPTEIGGGSGGSFERYTEPVVEYYEGDEWIEDRQRGFGFN